MDGVVVLWSDGHVQRTTREVPTPAKPQSAWEDARRAGLDMDLVEDCLRPTPTERIRVHSIALMRAQRFDCRPDPVERKGADSGPQLNVIRPRVDDPELIELEIGLRSPEGGRHRGRRGVLELETDSARSARDKEIQLGPVVRSPEVALAGPGPQVGHDGPHGEPLPRSADLRVPPQAGQVRDVHQSMRESRVRMGVMPRFAPRKFSVHH